ncbi:hypothetical protein DITRI_Ditri17bG0118200 [Diplodiscus trichospermus]
MMSWNHDSNHKTEQVVGVAAAAYVINLIAEPSIQDKKETSPGLESFLIKDKSRKEDTAFPTLKAGTVSERSSGKDAKHEKLTGESSTKGSDTEESKVPVTKATDEKTTRPAPSFKKSLTFADHIGTSKPESVAPKPDLPPIKPERAALRPDLPTRKPVSTAPKPDHPVIEQGRAATRPEQPPTIKPVAPGIDANKTRPETAQTKAVDWEKDEMAKIKERYVKLNSTILAWEEKKKKKAKNKLEKAESRLEQKRAQALTKFRNEMDYIIRVTDAAKAQAEARQRNDELKAKEKANIIRTTGEIPKTCFCC